MSAVAFSMASISVPADGLVNEQQRCQHGRQSQRLQLLPCPILVGPSDCLPLSGVAALRPSGCIFLGIAVFLLEIVLPGADTARVGRGVGSQTASRSLHLRM